MKPLCAKLKRTIVICWMAVLAICVSLPGAYGQSSSDQDATSVKLLLQLLNGIQSMSAKFQQDVVNGNGEALQSTQGVMKIQRPGKFYWQTDLPFEQKINSDGVRIWVYDVDLEQVTVQKVDPGLGKTPAALLSGKPEEVVQQFFVDGHVEGSGDWKYSLKPRDFNSTFSWIELQFNGKKLVSMKLMDSLRQTITVHFTDVVLNPVFSAQTFALSFPKDVDLIDNSHE